MMNELEKNVLDIHGVTKVYGEGRTAVQAVKDAHLHVKHGEIVLIMGPSGSGKTTLLIMAGCLLKPTSGSIKIGGREIVGLNEKQLPEIRRRNIGFVFQSFNLLANFTARENVEIVLNIAGIKGREAREKAISILTKLGLKERLSFKPAQLSGGEKQRVSIARALATEPHLVLADEPTANLDSKRGHEIMEILRRVAKAENRTVVIVSHDMRLMDIADRVLWLEDGKIKEGREEFTTDPICEMRLQQKLAPFSLKHKGQTYYFCSQKCFNEFKQSKFIS